VRDLSCAAWRIYLELELRRLLCRSCARVKRERLEFLTDNAPHTKRFAYLVGRRCSNSTIKEVADEPHLDWDSVKELDKQYMRAQLTRAGTPAPKVIGIDESSIRKRHTYRNVVSDLIRGRAIWFGGKDRSEESMSEFFAWLGEKKSRGIRLAVMDMWKPFRNATERYAPTRPSCSTSSTSCAIRAKPSTRSERASTPGSRAGSAASSRARSTPCCPDART
jgi:transposase